MGRIIFLLKMFRRDLILMVMAAYNRDTPAKVKALFLLALLYFVSPIDFIPDTIPFIGALDDAVIVPAAVSSLKKKLPPPVLAESETKTARIMERLSAIGIAVTLFIVAWLGLAVLGIYKLLS